MPVMEAQADRFDYIIVGAGSAGCVLANRLSADPKTRVLLVEAGGQDNWIWYHIPVGFRYAIGNPRADWRFQTEPEPGLGGRVLDIPRGKVIGGSSSINGLVYWRGMAADYDHWRQLGLPGWGWDDVLPLFKRHEDFFGGADAYHGAGGELGVAAPRAHFSVLEVARRAAIEAGIPPTDDFDTGDIEGVGNFFTIQRGGQRCSAAKGFLKPILHRPNLKLVTEVLVERVVFDGRRAVGISYRQEGASKFAHAAREVILAAGAIGSPHLLLLSGVGPAQHLQDMGIPVVIDREGVGANLHDHLQIRLKYQLEGIDTLNQQYNNLARRAWMGLEYALFRRGPLTMPASPMGIACKSDPHQEWANLQFNVLPFSYNFGSGVGRSFDRFPALTMAPYDVRPTSRGALWLKSPDPSVYPAMRYNFLVSDEDRRTAANAIRVTRNIMAQPALAPYRPTELTPGPSAGNDDEEALVAAAAANSSTVFHPVGSAKMGLPSDSTAVVDARLKLIGLEGLRVVDASIMPSIVSGNTNAPAMMIGEKGAAMILEDSHR